MRTFTLFYCILLCPVWLSSLGGLLFSEEEAGVGCGEMDLGREEVEGWEGGGKGNWSGCVV